MEIERKFLIRKMPEELEQYPHHHMEQGYLCTAGCILRIRKADDTCYLTYKRHGMSSSKQTIAITNYEVEEELPFSAYEVLKHKVDGNMVCKTRYYIPFANHTVELDVFEGVLQGLVVAEIEYSDEEDARTTPVPEWFGKEVSFDRRYRNSSLSVMSEPPQE